MWNPFRKKEKVAQGQEVRREVPNRIDALVNSLQQQNRLGDLEGELGKVDQKSLSVRELETWWHLYGISAFRDGREPVAMQRFEEGYSRFPNSAQIRFSLGQQYVRGGAVEKGFELFRRSEFPELPRDHVLAQVRYAYLHDKYEDGLEFMRPFFAAYDHVKILDDHFLYVRGLPFFGVAWGNLAALCVLSRKIEELERVTHSVIAHCCDYDFESLQMELKAVREDEPGLLLPLLEKRLASFPSDNFPTAYLRMQIAVIKSRIASSRKAAEEVLRGVQVGAQDFRWLEDVRTLALAECAERFCETDDEEKYRKEFLKRQPMLFEPNIAVDYQLLRYQEKIKSHMNKVFTGEAAI